MSEQFSEKSGDVKSSKGSLVDAAMYSVLFATSPIWAHRLSSMVTSTFGENAGLVAANSLTVVFAAGAVFTVVKKPITSFVCCAFAATTHVGGMAGYQDGKLPDWQGGCFDYAMEEVGYDYYPKTNASCNLYDLNHR